MTNKKIIIDGNSFYEIDLECLEKKKIMENRKKEINKKQIITESKQIKKEINKK